MNSIKYFFLNLLSTDDFPARWFCGKWSDFHGWLYISSNLIIWLSYFTIPVVLLYFVFTRKDLPLKGVFILFVFFILCCSVTHFLDAIIFWVPLYRLNAVFLFFTAMVSAITAVTMIKEIPKAADLKSPAQLQEIIDQKTAELKAANLELEKSKEVFKKISETNPDVIIRLNEDYKHLFVNKSIVKYSNLSPDTYIGKNYKDLNYTDEVRFFLESNITEALERNATVRGKIPFVDYNQSELMHEVVFVPLETPKGEKKEILTISRDITEEEKAKEALDQKVDELNKSTETLKQHNQQLEDFSYIVSHNLRSPVGNLLALHELYDAEESEQEKGFLFGTIKKVVVSLQQTIDDLTEIINIRLNKQIKVNPLKFSAAINKLSSTLETEIAKKDASIVIDLEEDYVLFNKAYLESIIQNLFTNALKYSDKKRKPIIKFTSKREHGFIALTCEDNGLGIDLTRHRDKIFKLHKTFHDNDDARGVGLFITKNQIEAFGGSIRVESEVGKGTKFILLFKADG